MSRLVVDLSSAEHLNLKTRAAINRRTISSYAKSYLFKIPNATTLEAIADIEKNKDLTEFGAVDEIFDL